MVLADTSIWVEHLRNGHPGLARLLEVGDVCTHPFVRGELACGNLANRAAVLGLLAALPRVTPVNDDEALALVERRRLMGRGVGWVDVHLLAACLAGGQRLWTLDHRLALVANELGGAYSTR